MRQALDSPLEAVHRRLGKGGRPAQNGFHRAHDFPSEVCRDAGFYRSAR